MKAATRPPADRVIRAGAWVYILPRLLKAIVLFAIVSLAASIIVLTLLLDFLRHHGA